MHFEVVSDKELASSGIGAAYRDVIKLPTRATALSAGYDFYSPIEDVVPAGGILKVPTGIRAIMEPGWVLLMYVRSSVGIKKNLVLANGTGVIDADYWMADNEGHIWVVLHNYGTEDRYIAVDERIAQGVFIQHGNCGDSVENLRVGGIGSTN